MWFDMPTSKTVDSVGAKTVLLKTTGHEKTRFTVVLACLADGTKLKPMVIFKRKTMPKDSGRNSSVKAMMKKNSMAFEEKQTNKQTAPLGATKYEKRNDQCFIVLKLALELSKYRYRGYLFVFKIYYSNFILEFQIICLFYLTDEN